MFLHWILAFVRDFLYFLKTLYQCRFDFSKPIIVNGPNGPFNPEFQQIPIILVHGSSGNQCEWLGSLEYVKKCFHVHTIYAFSLDLPFDNNTGEQKGGQNIGMIGMKKLAYKHDWDINTYAHELHERLVDLNLKFPCILIGHSMGGLIAAAYEILWPNNVLGVVAISSPFQGAPLLKHIKIHSKRHIQMTPDSSFLRHINNNLCRSKYITFGSPHDIQVPNNSSMINGVTEHYEIPGYGHLSIVSSPKVWEQVTKFFQRIKK